MPRAIFFTVLISLGLTGGCGGSDDNAAPERSAAGNQASRSVKTRPERVQAEIDRLQALPYAGFVEVDEGMEEDGVVVHDAERSCPGYNLYVLHELTKAELFDEEGRVINSWQHQPGKMWANGELLPNGDFIVMGAGPCDLPGPLITDDSRYIIRFNWQGEIIWKRKLTAHHDVEVTPRDQLLTLTFERRIVPEIDPEVPVRDDRLTLLSHAGEVLESFSLYDVLSARPELFPLRKVPPTTWSEAPWIDLFHCNSIEWMHHEHLVSRDPLYDLGNVLVCSRWQNRIFIVNWERKELLWSWGNGRLSGPHDARVLENGHILVFDNGVGRKRSRVLEVDPLSRKIVWRYKAPNPGDFHTITRGSNQRLPNGNTLITNSDHGLVFEVTPGGDVVWEFRCPYRDENGRRAAIVRAMRYERAYVERIQKLFE